MKLVVGLGNPGRKYELTRHNVGFDVLALVAQRLGTPQGKSQFHGETASGRLDGESVLLLQPHTFMNLSGQSVLAARDFYKLKNEDILVVCDDLNLPLGRLRFRASGSDGGQKGLANILNRLGTKEIARLRFGIDPPPAGWDAADHVLGKFNKKQREEVEVSLRIASDAVLDWVRSGVDFCMNRYNPSNA